MRNNNLHCRVCGFETEDPPWGNDGRSPIYDFCACCGVEHGYQDSSPDGARTYRLNWLKAGANWEDPNVRPDNWNIDEDVGG